MKGIIRLTMLMAAVAMVANVNAYGKKQRRTSANMSQNGYVTVTNGSDKVKMVKAELYHEKTGATGAKELQEYTLNPGQSITVENAAAGQLSKITFKSDHTALKYLKAKDGSANTLTVDNDMRKQHTIGVFVDGNLLEEVTLSKQYRGKSRKTFSMTNRQVTSIVCTPEGKTRIDLVTKQ